MKIKLLLLLILLQISEVVKAEVRDSLSYSTLLPIADSTSSPGKSTYTFGVDFGSNTSFKGVSQANQQWYNSPNFTYAAKSGFFIYSALYHLYGYNHAIDEFDLTVGYDWKLSKKALLSFSYSRFFYNSKSPQVQSNLTNNLETYFRLKLGKFRTKLILDYYFGNTQDFTLTWTINRPFTWESVWNDDDDITFTPKFKIVMGTDNFFYVKNPEKITLRKKGKSGKTVTTVTPAQVESVFTFGTISYVFTLPVAYTIKDFTIEPSFNYSYPGSLRVTPAYSYFLLSFYYIL